VSPAPLDLSTLEWTLTGWRPFAWRLRKSAETGGFLAPDHGPFPAHLPGSVQENLRRAGEIPDWLIGRNSLAIEWVEHRHWMFTAKLPALTLAPGETLRFHADVLDYSGWLLLDGHTVAEFRGPHQPTLIDVTKALLLPGPHELALVFAAPPEEPGQLGHTSGARSFKPRYNYGWDWCVRVVPSGAAGRLTLERRATPNLSLVSVTTTLSTDLTLACATARVATEPFPLSTRGEIRLTLALAGHTLTTATFPLLASGSPASFSLDLVRPALWWPHGLGAPTLHEFTVEILIDDELHERWQRRVGFKHVDWQPCEGAPAGALPWLCVVNGRPVFLQGVNWTPIRLCYLDTTPAETRHLVALYQELGCNLLRVWGGATLETEAFYDACDAAGLLVWQEFPLSSSGLDSHPPDDSAFIDELTAIARHFIRARQHHAGLLQWCGGNELHTEESTPDGPRRRPLDLAHPALAALAALVAAEDPTHRFLPTSPFGPRFHSTPPEFGRGLHHEVHGPWGRGDFPTRADWENYWRDDDSLFRGEVGVAGASPLDLILRHAGPDSPWPPTNALWQHSSGWWTQWDRFAPAVADLPPDASLAHYIALTQREQADDLALAARYTKARFPRCGGFLVWMGHDCFPCLANTAIIDCEHRLKPVALALAAVFRAKSSDAPA
jgi:beta-mannosidase